MKPPSPLALDQEHPSCLASFFEGQSTNDLLFLKFALVFLNFKHCIFTMEMLLFVDDGDNDDGDNDNDDDDDDVCDDDHILVVTEAAKEDFSFFSQST